MAHELEMINGEAQMFSVLQTPWHGLGKIVSAAPNVESVLELAGLNWNVSTVPQYINVNGNMVETEQRAIVRDKDNSVLGYCGDRYTPLQNTDSLEFFKSFADSGLVEFETAGSLRQGQKIWILAKLAGNSEMEIVNGDVVRKYLLLSNAHDGKTGIRVGFSPTRVVCANTLAMAHGNAESKLLRVFHSKKVKENLELIKDTVNLVNQSFEATAEQYRKLCKREVCREDIKNYVDLVFYNGAQADSDREKTARQSLNDKITRLFEVGKGQDIPGVRNTTWALYNAATEYLSYERGKDPEIRLDNLWFGQGRNLNQTALDTAYAFAESGNMKAAA